jgi:uncharacterized metal-binding protein
MPSGKTHDAITFLLILPTFSVAFFTTKSLSTSMLLTFAMLFGGLMFGPDLDIKSSQYSRWSIFRFLWFPYKSCFKHRSRWSHGLMFGSFFRVIYFFGVITLVVFATICIYSAYSNVDLPNLLEISKIWKSIGEFLRTNAGENVFQNLFIGIWIGAASHTFTDMAGSFIKHGKIMEFL